MARGNIGVRRSLDKEKRREEKNQTKHVVKHYECVCKHGKIPKKLVKESR
jgi:hypothetical protein